MTGSSLLPFARLLKRYRSVAGLTQEELAERAGLSVRAIGDLERGTKTRPHQDTVEMLADGLGLGPADRAQLEAAVDRRRGPAVHADRTVSRPPFAVPAALTPLLGRERDQAQVLQLLHRQGIRLLTLTGAGGVGKTRLALHIASMLQDDFADGVIVVPLASIRDPDLVLPSIAGALQVQQADDEPLVACLTYHLREEQMLLVLDNFEQVADAAPLLVELLASCSKLAMLVTSRVRLHVRGEQEVEVPPLALPDPARLHSADVLRQSPAVALFLSQVRTVKPDFQVTDDGLRVLAEICRRLDGLPLAIELAAARVKVLAPPALLARLHHRLEVLTGGPRDVPMRQQTMRNTIAWSYDLLEAAEQALFRRLSIFLGGFTLEATQAICQLPGGDELNGLEGLSSLVEKHLLLVEEQEDGEPRLGMLETVREYGLESLNMSGERQAIQRAHAAYFLSVAEAAEPHLMGREQAVWMSQLEREHDNLRAVLTWARDAGESEIGLRLARALWFFWIVHGYLSEGRGWFESMLALGQGNTTVEVVRWRGRALWAAGVLAVVQCDYRSATARLTEGLALFRRVGDNVGIASTFNGLGRVAQEQGDYERAVALYEESIALARAANHQRGVAMVLSNLGQVARMLGDQSRAVAILEESRVIFRELEHAWGLARAQAMLGTVLGDQHAYERAEGLLRESLALCWTLGDKTGVAICLEGLATIACARGRREHAVRLSAAAATLRESLASPSPPHERDRYEHTLSLLREALGGELFAAAWDAGRTMDIAQVIAQALEDDEPLEPTKSSNEVRASS
jgi:predicted ATPase/DNA-binding XRE family transcriptional regulator